MSTCGRSPALRPEVLEELPKAQEVERVDVDWVHDPRFEFRALDDHPAAQQNQPPDEVGEVGDRADSLEEVRRVLVAVAEACQVQDIIHDQNLILIRVDTCKFLALA